MDRRIFLILAAAGLSAAPSVSAAGPREDLAALLPDFYGAREKAAMDIKLVHDAVEAARYTGDTPAWSSGDATQLDLGYTSLAAAANALVRTIATQIKLNQTTEDRWKTDADVIVKRANDFDVAVREIARKQAARAAVGVPSRELLAVANGLIAVGTGLSGLVTSVLTLFSTVRQRKAKERIDFALLFEGDAVWPDLQGAVKGDAASRVPRTPQPAATPPG